jgi:hypothetical protein
VTGRDRPRQDPSVDAWSVRLKKCTTLALLGAAWLALPSAASAQTRVVLATRDPALESALEAALAPWNITLVVLDQIDAGAMPASAEHGAELARRHDAAAVTWISLDANGAAALWTYDAASARIVARALPVAPPFDEPTADAVALSIKTLLRYSAAAPPTERLVDPGAPSEWLVEIGAGARALATQPGDVEPRFALGVAAWPRALGGTVGFALLARSGTGVGIARAAASGRFGSADVSLGVRARLPLASLLDLAFGLELGISVAWLDATVDDDGAHVLPLDVDPTGGLWGELGLRPFASLRVAVRVGAFMSAITRSYLVHGRSILDTQPIAPFGELLFDVPLDGGRVDLP